MAKTARFRGFRAAVITLILAVTVAALVAQSVVDPQLAEFDPSPQHHEVASDGTPLVQSYALALYVSGQSTPFETVSLGKPAPDFDGKIRVNFLSLLSEIPASGVTYEARVSAVGPGGTAASDPSNLFSFSSLCSPHLNASVMSVPASGGTGTVGVSAEDACTWTATSNAAWLTITSGASGSGSGTIAFDVATNTSSTSRTGTITAAGQTFTVSQEGVACTYSLSPTSKSVGSSGGSVALTMTTAAACSWSASSNSSWLTITGGGSGSGNGTITVNIAAHTGSTSRTGTVTAGGKTFTVRQDASPCSYSLGSSAQSVPAEGASGSFAVNAGGDCSWTAASHASWLTLTSGTRGSGSGTVAYIAAANTTSSPRTGTITAAGQTFTVTQAAATACTYALSSSSASFPADGGSNSVGLTTESACTWTATSNAAWLSVTSGTSGTGSTTVAFSAAANTTSAARNATITAGGQTFTVSQAGVPCSHAVLPASQSLPADGGTGSVMVTGTVDCGWTASSNAPWITITAGASGVGGASFSYSVAPNPDAPRTGTVTAGGQTFTVSQAGAPCTYTLARASQLVNAAGGEATIGLTTGSACTWTAASTVAWITALDVSGTGSTAVGYRVEPNSGSLWRTGYITIGGGSFTVSQSGTSCTFTLDSTSQSVSAAGGPGAVTIDTGSTCFSSASSQASWITITSGGSGSGPRTVQFSVAPNPDTVERTGTLTIAGQTFTVTQAPGAGCTYAVSPTSQMVAAAGGAATVGMTTGSACEWVSSSNVSWLTVTSGASGTGSGTVGYAVEPNPAGTYRTGTLTIGGQRFSVSQAGVGCTFELDQTSLSMSAEGGTGTVTLTAPSGCFWLASSKVSWMTITSGTSGTGSRTFTFTVAVNTAAGSRTGTLVIAGKTFTVTQAGQ